MKRAEEPRDLGADSVLWNREIALYVNMPLYPYKFTFFPLFIGYVRFIQLN